MKRTKRLYIAFGILGIIGVLAGGLIGCTGSTSSAAPAVTRTATVQVGNLRIEITGSGNLAYSQTADLAFQMSGTVDSVSVKAGDSVKEGQELAKLDTSAWQDQVTALERQLTAAQRSLKSAEEKVTTTEKGVTTAQKAVPTAEKQVLVKQRSLLQAQINLKNAQTALNNALNIYTGTNIETAQADRDKAAAYLQYALDRRADPTSDSAVWDAVVERAQASLNAAQRILDTMTTNSNSDDVAIKRMQLQIAQGNVQDAQDAIVDAQAAIDDAKAGIADAQGAVVDAKAARDDAQLKAGDAQKALDEAKNLSPIIKASFDGFVTQVNVKGGDEINKGTIAVQIADPNKFQADIMVSEMDISKVKLEGSATVQADAMAGVSLPAKVTFISPTATVQQGVVNYKVTVVVTSLTPVQAGVSQSQRSQTGQSGQTQPASSGQVQSGQSQRTQTGQASQSGQGRSGQSDAVIQTVQLKQGLTVSINILVSQKTNVLLVPSRAITRQGQNATVQVVNDAGVVEVRSIKTGSSDSQNTEVTSGLTEGEKVILPQITSSGTTTNRPAGGIMIPGIGGPR